MANFRPAVPAAVGRYAMYAQIGAGGMATVHLGRAPREQSSPPSESGSERGAPGRVVAIKRLRPHFVTEPDVVKSFLDEARLSARVRHQNVVATLDVVTHEGEAFIVMEYVEGVSLSSLIRTQVAIPGAGVPVSFATSILSGVLRGLHAAHEAVSETGEPLHMVHRDVSPHNILVGVDGIARVLDFGIAKALGRQQTTRDGKIKGKLGYMAPEQLSGRGVTRRTDLFAAGIVLWELLTGEHLFRSDDEATTVTRVLMDTVRAPSKVRAGVPAALDPIVLRALERDPSKRFFSAEEMACALEEAVKSAGADAVGEWVKSVAAEELARRARLLREETETRLAFSASDLGAGTGSATVPDRLPTGVRGGRRNLRAAVAAAALVGTGLVAWGAVSSHRGKVGPSQSTAVPSAASLAPLTLPEEEVAGVEDDSKGRGSGLAAPPPSVVTPAPPEEAPAAGVPVHPPSKTSVRRAGSKPTPARGAPSARERLYSRD